LTKSSVKNPSPADLRKFGFLMAGVFLLFGLISLWRHHTLTAAILAGVGGLIFLLPALVSPALLLPVHRGWMRFALLLGWANSRILLTLLFFLLFTPISWVQKLIGRDPLARRFPDDQPTYWEDRSKETSNPKHFERQF